MDFACSGKSGVGCHPSFRKCREVSELYLLSKDTKLTPTKCFYDIPGVHLGNLGLMCGIYLEMYSLLGFGVYGSGAPLLPLYIMML